MLKTNIIGKAYTYNKQNLAVSLPFTADMKNDEKE